MKSVIFREARNSDIPELMDIRLSVDENKLSDPSKVTPEICSEYFTRLGKGWVCESEGRVIGFSIACAEDASIWALFVRPGSERLGIGRRLLDLATKWLFEGGSDIVSLSTGPNTRAARFYEKRGWKAAGTTPEGETIFRLLNPRSAR